MVRGAKDRRGETGSSGNERVEPLLHHALAADAPPLPVELLRGGMNVVKMLRRLWRLARPRPPIWRRKATEGLRPALPQ